MDSNGSNGWFNRLKSALSNSRERLTTRLTTLFSSHGLDDEGIDALEILLIEADCGMTVTQALIEGLQKKVRAEKLDAPAAQQAALVDLFYEQVKSLAPPALTLPDHQPFVILLCGINGAGKTTTIGKLTAHFLQQGKSILLAAGDTFRAAASEQLKVWAERNDVSVMAQKEGDPAAVAFDAMSAAKARKTDILIIDTAGRLPTQKHLMAELAKIKRVIQKADPTAPHATWLVIDGTVGQNSISQVKLFDEAVGVSGLIITKLDGTAKGGALAAIAQAHPIPLYFIGVGEQLDDLRFFDAKEFAQALLSDSPYPTDQTGA